MLERGLVTSTVGNISARGGAGMLITPTRVHPEDLTPESVVEIALDGQGGEGPSLEWRLHAAVYEVRRDVAAIVHTHSPYAVARSFDPEPLIVDTEERVYLGLDRVEVAPPGDAGTPALARAAAAALGERDAVLLARHGVVATGQTPRDALELGATIEHLAIIDHVRAAAQPTGRPPAPRLRSRPVEQLRHRG